MKSKMFKFIKPFISMMLSFGLIFSLSACTNKSNGTNDNNGSGTNDNLSPNPTRRNYDNGG